MLIEKQIKAAGLLFAIGIFSGCAISTTPEPSASIKNKYDAIPNLGSYETNWPSNDDEGNAMPLAPKKTAAASEGPFPWATGTRGTGD